ncbi:alpha/beta hydrolase [Amycolatopsis aidingensis]|uniref:alpha/beta hydrolase n=1 Tax=Amycolatopsis aidingensis TaxID=2842453 RepID=UPI001E496BF1|nr:alpha/beta fold hydrolase [Amycolatopsis aidingensis]
MDRTEVTFPSAGVDCAAWLYRPAGTGPHPLVVLAHGFSGTRELRLDAYAERFHAAGLGVLLFDYRFFGASGGQPRQLLDITCQLHDWHHAVAYARSLDWVDPARIALFGSSYSGGHVVTVAAEDPRIAAVVAQCPFSDGLATVRRIGPLPALRLTGHALLDQLGALAGRQPHYVPAVAAPGASGMMTTPDAKPGMEALVPAETNWRNRVAARVGLRVPFYRPGRKAGAVRCPALWCVTDRDSLCPAENTVRHARKAPRGEIKRYPIGHFDIYLGEWFERAVADQTEFLRRHLLPDSQR